MKNEVSRHFYQESTTVELQKTVEECLTTAKSRTLTTGQLENLKRNLLNVSNNLSKLSLVTTAGFAAAYFDELPYHKTGKDTFNNLNNYYCRAFGEKKYSSFNDFRKCLGFSA